MQPLGPDKESLDMLRELYPELTEGQLVEAYENLERYLRVAIEIGDMIRESPELQRKYEQVKEDYRLLTEQSEPGSLNAAK